jgi:hypothetical protein
MFSEGRKTRGRRKARKWVRVHERAKEDKSNGRRFRTNYWKEKMGPSHQLHTVGFSHVMWTIESAVSSRRGYSTECFYYKLSSVCPLEEINSFYCVS